MTRVTTVRLSNDLAARLDVLAAVTNRSHTWLIEQAIRQYVDEEAGQDAAVADELSDFRSRNADVRNRDEMMKQVGAQIRAIISDKRAQT